MKKNLYTLLPRKFYQQETTKVAQQLLGKYLIRKWKGKNLIGKIIETEAYLPFDDPAAHGYKGVTPRNEILFKEAGYTYIHSIHRYYCMDIVTETVNRPGSVLIRAIEPITLIDVMKNFRKTNTIRNLSNGPGKLCQALTITRDQNGIDVTKTQSEIHIGKIDQDSNQTIIATVRIGISKAKDLPLRFYISSTRSL